MVLDRNNLHTYQERGVEHCLDNPAAGLFLDMGLGKTVTTLTVITELIYVTLEVNTVLIIAPKRVIETVWAEEAKKWGHLKHLRFSKIIGTERQRLEACRAKADIYLISRDNVAWLVGAFGGSKTPFDMLVIDELSSFKNPNAQRFKALKKVRPFFKRVIGLTGTPAPNGLLDLWSQIYLLDYGERLGRFVTHYRQQYFSSINLGGFNKYTLNKSAEQTIRDKIADIVISMKARDYLDMPKRVESTVVIDLPSTTMKAYHDFERDQVLEAADIHGEMAKMVSESKIFNKPFSDSTGAKLKKFEISATSASALWGKLCQFANGAVYDSEQNWHEVHDEKIKALQDLIEEANGQSVLIAWSFRHDEERIMKALSKYKPTSLKGQKDASKVVSDWNAGKIQVLLAHPASAGHGLNLQAGGHIVVWFGLNPSLELYQQFNARLDRQGQTETTSIVHLVTRGTVDEDIVKSLKDKDRTQESLMEALNVRIKKYLEV